MKLLKDKNIYVKEYKKEAIKVLLTPNIKDYSMYVDNFYLNVNRKSKNVIIAINIIQIVMKRYEIS